MTDASTAAEAARAAIIEALAIKPMSKREFAHRLAVRPNVLFGCLATLATRGRIVIRGGRVGLPGQLPEGEPRTSEEEQLEQFRQLWHRRGILAVCPADIEDGFLRERLCLIGNAMYGRRGAPR